MSLNLDLKIDIFTFDWCSSNGRLGIIQLHNSLKHYYIYYVGQLRKKTIAWYLSDYEFATSNNFLQFLSKYVSKLPIKHTRRVHRKGRRSHKSVLTMKKSL